MNRKNALSVLGIWLALAMGIERSVCTASAASSTPSAIAELSTEDVIRRMADDVIRATDLDPGVLPPGRPPSRYNEWMYQNFMLCEAMDELGRVLDDARFRSFARRNVEFFIAWERTKSATDSSKHLTWYRAPTEMWHCGMVAALADQQRTQPTPGKQRGLEIFDAFLAAAPKLADGTLVRFKRAPYDSPGLQIDDLYMVAPYWVRLGKLTGERRPLDRAVDEALRYFDYLWNPRDRLLHCLWLEKTRRPAAHYWGRGNGWYVMALTDLLQHLPADHPKRAELLADFRTVMAGLAARQSANGLWHQLLDHSDSFAETSGSGMFTWGFLKGANEGWLGADAAATGRKGWAGLRSKLSDDFRIKDVCPASGMNEDVAYYYNRPRIEHDQHAIGPFLLAGAERLRMK